MKSADIAVCSEAVKRQAEIQKLIRTAFYVAKSGLAFTKYIEICKLQQLNGMEVGTNYLTDLACKRFVELIASNIKEDLRQQFNSCRFVTVMSDGSTDKGILKKYYSVIYGRLLLFRTLVFHLFHP